MDCRSVLHVKGVMRTEVVIYFLRGTCGDVWSMPRTVAQPERHFRIGDLVATNPRGPAAYRGRRGQITETMPSEHECRVDFDDGVLPTTGYLMTHWLVLATLASRPRCLPIDND